MSTLAESLFEDFRTSSVASLLERLDQPGVSPNLVNEQGQTLLSVAARWGMTEHVIALKGRVDPLLGDRMGMTAMLWAVNGQHLDVVQHLLAPATVRQTADDGCTPLMLAAANHDVAMVNLLLPLSEPAAVSTKGWTALMYAAHNNQADNLATLLPLSDADVRDRQGRTAWLLAAEKGASEALAVLRPHVNTHATDANGNTALMRLMTSRSIRKNDILAAFPGLLAMSDTTAVNHKGETVLRQVIDLAFWAPVPVLLAAMPRSLAMAVQQDLLGEKDRANRSAAQALRRFIQADLDRERRALGEAMASTHSEKIPRRTRL